MRLVDVRRWLQSLQAGRIDPVSTVSLAVAPAVTTTVTQRACSTTSCVVLTPTNAAAATEVGAGGLYVTPGNGSFVITHSAVAGARTFSYAIISRAQT